MFRKSARWYDALYSFKDYARESAEIISIIKEDLPEAEAVLDVACGTGEHDRYLSEVYRVDGIDANGDFLRVAESKNPHGRYIQGDMCDFSLDARYDVLLCLFSSIGYVRTMQRLNRTLMCFREHLNPGGMILVEPWFTPDRWRPDGRVHMLTAESELGSICRMSSTDTRKSQSMVKFHYLEGTMEGVAHFTETHLLGLFTVEQMTGAFTAAGLECRYDPEGITGRGLYIGRSGLHDMRRDPLEVT